MEDRKELRKLLEDTLESLDEKEELLRRLDVIEQCLEKLNEKIDKLGEKLDSKKSKADWDQIFEKIKGGTSPKTTGNPPWATPNDWGKRDYYNRVWGCLDGKDHEYPSPWMAIVPPSCKKCGKSAPDMNSTCWHPSVKGIGGLTTSYTDSKIYLDDSKEQSLKLSDTLHNVINAPIVPEGAGIVTDSGMAMNNNKLYNSTYGLTTKPKQENNPYRKF